MNYDLPFRLTGALSSGSLMNQLGGNNMRLNGAIHSGSLMNQLGGNNMRVTGAYNTGSLQNAFMQMGLGGMGMGNPMSGMAAAGGLGLAAAAMMMEEEEQNRQYGNQQYGNQYGNNQNPQFNNQYGSQPNQQFQNQVTPAYGSQSGFQSSGQLQNPMTQPFGSQFGNQPNQQYGSSQNQSFGSQFGNQQYNNNQFGNNQNQYGNNQNQYGNNQNQYGNNQNQYGNNQNQYGNNQNQYGNNQNQYGNNQNQYGNNQNQYGNNQNQYGNSQNQFGNHQNQPRTAPPPNRAQNPPPQPVQQNTAPKTKAPKLPSGGRQCIAGQKVSLGADIRKLKIGLNWDVRDARCDLDASAFLLNASRKVPADEWFVFYGQEESPDGSTKYRGYDVGGAELFIDLSKVRQDIERIAVAVTIYEAVAQRLNFSMVNSVRAALINPMSNQVLAAFDLTDCSPIVTALVVGEIYRYKNEWKFNAVGSGVSRDLAGFCSMYGVNLA